MTFGWPGYFTTQLYPKYKGLCLCRGKRLCGEFMPAAFGRPIVACLRRVKCTGPSMD
jgi:hypothetical protein